MFQRKKRRVAVIERAWKYRIYPTELQQFAITGQGHTARALWNLIHDYYTFHHRRRPTATELAKAIQQGRRDLPWLAELPAQACQQIQRTYLTSWKRFFAGTSGRPQFKGRSKTRSGFDVPQARDLNITRTSDKWATVNIAKVGVLRYRNHRPLPAGAVVSGARIVADGEHWQLVLRLTLPRPTPLPVDRPREGADRGTVIPLAISDGNTYTHGNFLTPGETRRLTLAERRSARMRQQRHQLRGKRARQGGNEIKQYQILATLRARATRRREYWQHQTSRHLAQTYQGMAFEKLNVKNMTRSAKGTAAEPGRNVAAKSGLNRTILNEGWSAHLWKISYKIDESGGEIVFVPAPGTSQTCHRCQSTAPGQRQNQALFNCLNPACGWTGNADYNAANNIKHRAYQRGSTTAPNGAPAEGLKLCPAVGLTDADCPGYEPGKPKPAPPATGIDAPATKGTQRRQEQNTAFLTAAS